ncbi:hypothetical protein DLAC_11345 [Tieghemostelium lacteum]|uniref:Uncharacterized protein n=1 Tax=Tieghemostelium lacteum TaxID=361077 RepID=A0A151Z478_TIELA|nr:hypothetical protein DLAC_11345 [Tieghemostelium lacteum]|eukprot:KYQ88604.1 hypothetical protein DLAC_11345 [Tieghemostelium lacteum]
MENLYIHQISSKKQAGTFIMVGDKFNSDQQRQLIDFLKKELSICGTDRISRDLKSFLSVHCPMGTLTKFKVHLDHDFINVSSGFLGFISDTVIDAYDTLAFSNIETITKDCNGASELENQIPTKQLQHLFNIENLVSAIKYQKDPSKYKSLLHIPVNYSYAYQHVPPKPLSHYNFQKESTSTTTSNINTNNNNSSVQSPTISKVYKHKVKDNILSSPPINAARAY